MTWHRSVEAPTPMREAASQLGAATMAEQTQPTLPNSPPAEDPSLKEALRAMIREVTEVDDIPDETPFADLGIDSMMAIEIVAEVERTYKLSIPEGELQELTCFRAVFEKVSSKMAGAGASR